MTQRQNLKSLNRVQLSEALAAYGVPSYRSNQVFQWLYQKGVSDFEAMSNLPKQLRTMLAERFEIRRLVATNRQKSADGTIKTLFGLEDGRKIETVLIPEFFDDGVADRLTVCVSSQVGCVFGCKFCATGKMGFFRHLEAWEIADQLQQMNEMAHASYGKGITNVVYMGMGEPLHNYTGVLDSIGILTDQLGIGLSPKRITVSTVGLTHMIRRLGDENQPFNLAVSLHAANDDKRNQIMPVNKHTNLEALKEALQHYHAKTGKSVTYEYLLFQNFNDTAEDARQLASISRWIPSKVNVIMYNNVSGVKFDRASENHLDRFLNSLSKAGVLATVRRSRGDDIDAGCGQLAIRDAETRGKSLLKFSVAQEQSPSETILTN
jgi:23S rRNA (adenine2503-C2)-methyltransferase